MASGKEQVRVTMYRPNREPDLVIGVSSFWWEEEVSGCDGFYYHFNPEDWTILYFSNWLSFNGDFMRAHGDKCRESYAKWLLEKELLNK